MAMSGREKFPGCFISNLLTRLPVQVFFIVCNLRRQCWWGTQFFLRAATNFQKEKPHNFVNSRHISNLTTIGFRCENAWRCDHLDLWNHLAAWNHCSNSLSLALQGLPKGSVKVLFNDNFIHSIYSTIFRWVRWSPFIFAHLQFSIVKPKFNIYQ